MRSFGLVVIAIIAMVLIDVLILISRIFLSSGHRTYHELEYRIETMYEKRAINERTRQVLRNELRDIESKKDLYEVERQVREIEQRKYLT